MCKIITISGSAQHGKDTLAKEIKKEGENIGLKICILHHAAYLKMIASEVYGWNGEKDEKGRTLLQQAGDKLRKANPNILVDKLHDIIKLIKDEFNIIIIPDTRFPSEIDHCKQGYDTISLKIKRYDIDGTPFDNDLTEEQKYHNTETALNSYSFDKSIVNITDNYELLKESAINILNLINK